MRHDFRWHRVKRSFGLSFVLSFWLCFAVVPSAVARDIVVSPSDSVAINDWMQSEKLCNRNLLEQTTNGVVDAGLDLEREIHRYQQLVERSLTYRAESIRVARKLKERIANQEPLNGYDLDLLNEGMLAHLELRKELWNIAERYECLVDAPGEVISRLGISPETRLRAVMFSLSAALVLYDNYLLAIAIYEEDDKLRRLLNDRDTGYNIGRFELANVSLSYNSIHNRKRTRDAIRFFESNLKHVSEDFLENADTRYIYLLINQSPSYQKVKNLAPFDVLSRKVSFFGAASTDKALELRDEGVNLFSMLFGNSLGLVATRKGKLYGRNEIAGMLNEKLQAGDILVEKTPFRLTDQLIPGHWGHAAIWVGTEQELKQLGIWEHPVVIRYHSEIRRGHRIVEALRTGVQMSSLEKFLNIDDLGILRNNRLKPDQRSRTIIRALRQVGKAYDFNFDVETTDRIVCSELVYVSFTDIDWPTESKLGRATISPDNVASKAFGGGPLQLIDLYIDGEQVVDQPVKKLQLLMRKD